MEYSLNYLSTLGVATISVIVFAFFFRYKSRKNDAMLPPGQTGWPLVGETIEYVRCIKNGNPSKFILDRMTKHSPDVFKTSLMGEKMVVFCGAVGNKCLFSTADSKSIAWFPHSLSKIVISPENRGHDSFKFNIEGRKFANLFLMPEVVHRTFVGVMDVISKAHIEKKWAPHQTVLAFDLVKDYTFSLACKLFIGMDDPREVEKLRSLFDDITAGLFSVPINFPGTSFNRAIKSSYAFRKQILPIIKQRKIDLLNMMVDGVTILLESQDMMSQMILSTYNQDGKFPGDLLMADMILGFFVAGHDTTSSTITFMIKYLAEHPHVYSEVLKEQMEIGKEKKEGQLLNWKDIQKMKYTWNLAHEVMRLAPPAQGTFREATTDFTCAGFTIPKGSKMYWTVHSTNLNPDYFKNPEIFDLTRFQDNGIPPYTFVPFGGGTHICPGREYARIEILVFIHNLVTQFELETLLPDDKIIYLTAATPANGLPIRLHPRNGKGD